MSVDERYTTGPRGKRAMDGHVVESRHIADKLYHQNEYSKPFDQLYLNKDPFYTYSRVYYDSPRSEISDKKLKNPKSLSDIFHRFTDQTSLQAIPFITAATKWYAKALWSVIFLGAVGAWLLHSVILIQSYIKFETNSQVKITHENLDFPTITICNINPIRENTIGRFGGDDLQELLELLRPRTSHRGTTRKKRQTAVGAEENVDRDHDFTPFSGIDWTEFQDVGAFGEYLDGDFSSSYLAKYLLREMLIQLPDYNRTQMGHRMGDMMLGCSYDGKTCNAMNFTRFLDISYGNCFSFNSAELYEATLTSKASGSSHGLDVILYIQNREYIKGIQQGRGIRLDIHPFGTQPFVEEGGISIPTGFQTYLGLRQIKQTRLGGKYGACGDDGAYEQYFDDYVYTLDACTQTCVDRTVSATCGCYKGSRKQFYNDKDIRTLRPCNSRKELKCASDINADFESGKIDCNCNQACETTDYDYLLSYDQWPDATLWHSLVDSVCVSVSEGDCRRVKETLPAERESFLAKNFIHLKIYYRDLNIETIKETADYEDIQFYSDIGGAIGLWLGASVITLFELLDMGCRCGQFCAKRKTYQKRRDLRDRFSDVKSRGSLPSMHSSPAQIRRIQEEEFGPRRHSEPRSHHPRSRENLSH